MKYFVMLGGERKGAYTLGQMQAMWNAGTLTSETLFWQEGLSSWEPVSAIQSDIEAAPQPSPIVASGQPPQPTPPAQHDQVIYADESVTVTTNRVSIQGTTRPSEHYVRENGSHQARLRMRCCSNCVWSHCSCRLHRPW